MGSRFLRLRSLVAAALVAVFVVGATPTPASAAYVEAAETRLFNLINKGREARGKPKLEFSNAIRREARKHSRRMARDNAIHHKGFAARVNRIAANSTHSGQACENVAYTFNYPQNQAMKTMFKGWVKSVPHRNCMFDMGGLKRKRVAGVGVFKKGAYFYATFIAFQNK